MVSGLGLAVTFDGRTVDHTDVEVMAAAASHRGANVTMWQGPGAALLAQRTAAAGPATSVEQLVEVAGLVAVVDARIDNRSELQSALIRHGYLVDAHQPTNAELVLAAFRLWGDACPSRMIGDFAFAVWDVRRRRLFAARDPMGMRPLYVHRQGRRRVLLASEIKQILAVNDVPCRIFEPAIATTLAGPYTPPSWTTYQAIDQIAPGHALVADRSECRTFRFWAPDPGDALDDVDEASATAMFRSTFAASIEARLAASRTAGVLLSGGIDSGSVASMAGLLLEQRIPGNAGPLAQVRTYSWAFEELPDSDERHVSAHIVQRFGLTGVDVAADEYWPLACYPDHTPDRDDPFSGVYQPIIDHTSERCRADGVDLQVGGNRGDELTGDWVYDEFAMLRAGRVGDALTDLLVAAREPGMSSSTALRRRVLRPIVSSRWPQVSARLTARRGHRRPWPPWVRDDFAARLDLGDIIQEVIAPPRGGSAAYRQRYQRLFMAQGARIAVLRNRTAARFGMDFADPYADRRLVTLVLQLPQWLVQRRGRPKQILRRAMEGIVPPAALRQARKTIPYAVFDRGFRERAVHTVHSLLTSSQAAAAGWLDEEAARAVYDGYRRHGETHWDFWWPLTVEMWLRRWWPSR